MPIINLVKQTLSCYLDQIIKEKVLKYNLLFLLAFIIFYMLCKIYRVSKFRLSTFSALKPALGHQN